MPYSDSYWKRREEADEEREGAPSAPPEPEVESAEGAQVAAPERIEGTAWMDSEEADAPGPLFGPVEPPPPTPADVAPPPPGPPEFADYAPSAPKVDETKAQRLKAIENIRRLSEQSVEAPAGLRDSDIAAAQGRDRDEVRRSNLSEAIAAAFARRPARLQQMPGEAQSLIQRRQASDSRAAQQLGRKMTAEEKIAAVLRGEKVAGMTPYQVEQAKRQATIDEQNRVKREEDKKRQTEADRIAAERFEETKRHNKQTEGALWSGVNRADRKEDKTETQDLPPGHEVTPGANPGPDSRKKFTALVASQQKMKELTAAMRAELKGAGALDRMLPGEKRRRLQQLATQVKIEGKNVAELGALSGPDMSLMDAMATDPTSVSSLFGGNLDSNLAGMDTWADSAVRAGSKTYGIRPIGGGGPQAPSAVVPVDEKPPAGAIPPNASNVRKFGKGWAYTLADGSEELWEP